MTLDEAIEFCNEKSKNIKLRTEPQTFEQISEWLELLQYYEQGMEDIPSESGVLPKDVYSAGYNKAIDDFVEKSMEKFTKYDLEHGYPCIADIKVILRDIAEQLKGGGMDG